MKLFGAQRRETAKPLQVLELMKGTFDCGGNTRQRSAGVRRREGNSLDLRKDDFLKLMMQSSRFFQERCKTGLFVSYDLLREEAIKKATYVNIPQSRFKASKGWAMRFMCCMGLALRRRTICQKLQKDFDQKLLNYQRYIINLRKMGNFLMGQIANADETAIYLDMPPNYMLEKKSVKEVLLKTTGCEKIRLTVMLAATADGRKLPPLLILKRLYPN